MPVPDLSRTASGDPASSTLPPDNIDSLPEIIDPRDDPDPPPPFVERADSTSFQPSQARPWAPEKLAVRNPDDEDSPRASIVSGGNRNSIIVRAELLREQAKAEEKERDRLRTEQKKALSEKRYADAVKYKVEQEEASERVTNLHRRAAERFFKAHNLQPEEEHTIDVHRLKPTEATRRTEIAIRDALVAGATRLRVICGRGVHSKGGLPVLKLALIAAMEQNKIETEVDPNNPGVLNIKLPVS
jgi:DNA-nicking Smr family endonuclease